MAVSKISLNLAVAVFCGWRPIGLKDNDGVFTVLAPKDPEWLRKIQSRNPPVVRKKSPKDTSLQLLPSWEADQVEEESWRELLDYLTAHGVRLAFTEPIPGIWTVQVSSKGKVPTKKGPGPDRARMILEAVVDHFRLEGLASTLFLFTSY